MQKTTNRSMGKSYQSPYTNLLDRISQQYTKAKSITFTEKELDFIINYDIKYRMVGELESEE
jgi:hypothetical protein